MNSARTRAIGAPILAVRRVVGGIVGIVAGSEPRHVAQRRRMQQLSFGRAERRAEFPLRHRVDRGFWAIGVFRCARTDSLTRVRGERSRRHQHQQCDRYRRRSGPGTLCRHGRASNGARSPQRKKNNPPHVLESKVARRAQLCDSYWVQGSPPATVSMPPAAQAIYSFLGPLIRPRYARISGLSPAAPNSATNHMRRRRNLVADDRVIDVEAKWTGFIRIV